MITPSETRPPFDFHAFCAAVRARSETYPSVTPWTTADWMVALVGEVGELANLLKKARRDGVDVSAEMAAEAADIFAYFILLVDDLGIDLAAASVAKFNVVSERIGSPVHMRADGSLIPDVPAHRARGEDASDLPSTWLPIRFGTGFDVRATKWPDIVPLPGPTEEVT